MSPQVHQLNVNLDLNLIKFYLICASLQKGFNRLGAIKLEWKFDFEITDLRFEVMENVMECTNVRYRKKRIIKITIQNK